MQCYHIFSNSRGVYLPKNHHEPYSPIWYQPTPLAHGLLQALQNSLDIEMTRCSPGNSFNLCCGVTLLGSELVEDDEHRRFPQPRFVRTLRFLFCAADFGAFSTSKMDVDSSSRSDPEVVSTNEVDSGAGTISPESPPPSAMINAQATCFLINAHMFYTRLCWHNSL